jgi:hypothetical protein
VQDDDGVLWQMTGSAGRILECVIRFAPVAVNWPSSPEETFAQRYTTGTEATAFPEEIRADRQRKGRREAGR